MPKSPFPCFSGRTLLLMGLLATGGVLLLIEHGQHLLAWAPYLIFLLCPLMHLFMHRGHHRHHGSHEKDMASRSDGDKFQP